MTMRDPLASVLRERGDLLDDEAAYLALPAMRALPPRERLERLADNRRIGFWVTVFAGGVRLGFLAMGAVLMPLVALEGEMPIEWWSIGLWLALVGFVAWLTPGLVRRIRALRRKLPEWREIEAEVRARS